MVSLKQQQQHLPLQDASGVAISGVSPRDVFDATGDAAAAFRVMVDNANRQLADEDGGTMAGSNEDGSTKKLFQTPQEEYNALILTTLAKAGGNDSNLLRELEEAQDAVLKSSASTGRKRKREEWILTYNQGLILLASGQIQNSVNVVWAKLQPLVMSWEDKQSMKGLSGDVLKMACRAAFLLIECILTLWPMRPVAQDNATPMDPDLDVLYSWLEEQVEKRLPTDDSQLKFLLSLYKSRIDFFERGADGNISDSNIRSARKELKQAMEIFQHKLRATNDSGSLASSSYSEQDNTSRGGAKSPTPLSFGSVVSGNHNSGSSSSNSNMSRILQAQNQAALNLKANTEQLKGNIKKALILCAEAQGFHEQTVADDHDHQQQQEKNAPTYYDAIHQNNLAIVYETSRKSHVALHAFSKALRSSCCFDAAGENPAGRMFDADGTAQPNLTLPVLHNAAICSLKASNYVGAYECMAICIRESPVWRSRPCSWLRLAEACIGLETKRKKEHKEARFSKVEWDGCVLLWQRSALDCAVRVRIAND
jgi:tetratricopeptide (TPR) repeat protein